MATPKSQNDCPLSSWTPERRATRSHIRNSIHYALCEKRLIATKPDDWNASIISLQWRDDARARSVKQLARHYLEYWRLRAFMSGGYLGTPGDREAHMRWNAHAS